MDGHALVSGGIPRRGGRRGVNLIEVLVGLSIFTLCFLFIMGAFPTCARSVHQARGIFLANQLAQQTMDTVCSQPFSAITATYIANLPTSASIISIDNGTTEVLQFSISTTLTTPVSGDSNLKDVRCQVSWSDQGILRYVNLETIVANI